MAEGDTTGMAQAQNRDVSAAKPGRIRSAGRFLQSYANPWSDAYKTRKKEKEEEAEQKPEVKAAPNLDRGLADSQYVNLFKRHLIAAMRTGHDVLAEADEKSPANLIRQVVTRPEFISAIAQGTMKTPHEEVDEDYEELMQQKRVELARELQLAQDNPRYLLGEFDTDHLDIIFSAFFGSAPYHPDNKLPGALDVWKRVDEEGKPKHPKWPENLPMPPEAFKIFMESVARLQTKGEEGEDAEKRQGDFVGDVCKFLSLNSTRSFTSRQGLVLRQLVDGHELGVYVQSHSSDPIEVAVSAFLEHARRLLNTPTDQMDPELGVPGIGYADLYLAVLERHQQLIDDAEERIAAAKLAVDGAEHREGLANDDLKRHAVYSQKLLAALQQARESGEAEINGRMLSLDQIKGLTDEANEVRTQASATLKDAEDKKAVATLNLERAENLHKQRTAAAEEYAKTSDPDTYAEGLASSFRAFLQNQGGENLEHGVNDAAEKMVGLAPNTPVKNIMEKTEDVLKKKVALEVNHKDPLTDENRREMEDLLERLDGLPSMFERGPRESDINVLSSIAMMFKMLPGKLDKEQLTDEQRMEFAKLGRSIERLPHRFSMELPMGKDRGKLEALVSAKKGELEPLVRAMEMAKSEERQLKEANRQELWGLVVEGSAMLQGIINEDSAIREENLAFGYAKNQLKKELAELRQQIDQAALPPEVKGRLSSIYILLSRKEPVAKEKLDRMIKDVKDDYTYPVKQAAMHAIEKLKRQGYGQYTGLSNVAWLNAKIRYEYHEDKQQETVDENKGRWKRFTAFVGRWSNNFTSFMWWARFAKYIYVVAIGRDIQKIRNRNRGDRKPEVVKRRDGTAVPGRKWPNAVRGLTNILFKGWVGAVIAGYLISHPNPSWWPPTWFSFLPSRAYEAVGGSPYIKKQPWYEYLLTPWRIFMPLESDRKPTFVINDHRSNPHTLHKRGYAYYRQNYGVGTRDVERGSSTRIARLKWVQEHPDVLRFFQERIDGFRVVSVNDHLRKTPRTCRSRILMPIKNDIDEKTGEPRKRLVLPKSCQNIVSRYEPTKGEKGKPKKLFKTVDDLIAYPYGDKERGWDPDASNYSRKRRQWLLCCTIELKISTKGMAKGSLRLNPAMTDTWVDWLMATERGTEKKGQKIDYKFMTSKENMFKWTKMWFLVPIMDRNAVRELALTKKENVSFVVGRPKAYQMMSPICAKKALSMYYLKKSKRDAFVEAWLAELAKLVPPKLEHKELVVKPKEGKADEKKPVESVTIHVPQWLPTLDQKIPDKTLLKAFKAAKEKHIPPEDPEKLAKLSSKEKEEIWFTDRTQEYKRQKVMDAVPFLQLQMDDAKDALVANKDILELVKKFKAPAPYLIDTDRSDNFVLKLALEKRMRGDTILNDYDPLASQGSNRLNQAVSNGFLIKVGKDQLKEGKGTVIKQGSGSTIPKTGVYNSEVATFYTNNPGFTKLVENAVEAMFKAGGRQGRIMTSALSQVFKGDRTRMNNTIKAHVYNMIDKKTANVSNVRMTTEGGTKKILFPPVGHRARARTVKGIKGVVQSLLVPLFRKRGR